VRVIGLGTQDSLDQAISFTADNGLETPLMTWDPGFDSWIYYGVNSQPTAILVDPAGNPLAGWRGAFDLDEVLRLASEL